MAMDFDPRGWNRRPVYLSVTGVITQMQMTTVNGSGYGGCTQLITVEDEEGGTTNFFMNANTYVVNFETLYESMPVTVFYSGNQAAPLIYPPQFVAAVVAPQVEGQMVTVAYFNNVLTASDQSLKLNLSPATEVVTRNNQTFYGNPGGNTLVVLYSSTTRSVPPQTSPHKIIVMCGM